MTSTSASLRDAAGLGAVVSVHRESWRGPALAMVGLVALAAWLVTTASGEHEVMQKIAASLGLGIPAVMFGIVMLARRCHEIVVHERGLVWLLGASRGAARWEQIASVHAYPPGRKPMQVVVTVDDGGRAHQFSLTSATEGFAALCEALRERRPCTATLPAARIV